MYSFGLLAVSFVMNIVAVLFVICCVVLILVILIQKGRGGGLSSAFGGGMAGSLLGTKTGDFLTWVTIVLTGVFLMLAGVMAKFYRPTVTDYGPGAPAPQSQPAEDAAATGDEAGSATEANTADG